MIFVAKRQHKKCEATKNPAYSRVEIDFKLIVIASFSVVPGAGPVCRM